uniref:Uncharacterized protein n=1 Tax=Steinernema glaseri TaxID=37863 RepID=A0A1I7ZNB4_9BILA
MDGGGRTEGHLHEVQKDVCPLRHPVLIRTTPSTHDKAKERVSLHRRPPGRFRSERRRATVTARRQRTLRGQRGRQGPPEKYAAATIASIDAAAG